MQKHFLNFLSGIAGVFILGSPRPYPRTRNGFARDQAKLRGDAGRVAKGLRDNVTKAYGEPASYYKR